MEIQNKSLINRVHITLFVAGAAEATPPTQPARSKNRASELISSPELIGEGSAPVR